MKKMFNDIIIEIIYIKEDVLLDSGLFGSKVQGLQEDDELLYAED